MAQSPDYYTRGSVEIWDFIRDQDLNYHLGNAIKYICRAGFKNEATKRQDLQKAIHYLQNELLHTIEPRAGIQKSVWNRIVADTSGDAEAFDR